MITNKHLKQLGFTKLSKNVWYNKTWLLCGNILSRSEIKKCFEISGYWHLKGIVEPTKEINHPLKSQVLLPNEDFSTSKNPDYWFVDFLTLPSSYLYIDCPVYFLATT